MSGTPTPTLSGGLTINEFTALNPVSRSMVERGIARGEIPSYKIGKSRRIPRWYAEELQRCGTSSDAAS